MQQTGSALCSSHCQKMDGVPGQFASLVSQALRNCDMPRNVNPQQPGSASSLLALSSSAAPLLVYKRVSAADR
jgi:hypothetical protein